MQEKILKENQTETKKLAKAKDNQLDQMDFFKNSFWGTPIPMTKINRILDLK